ncbi:MULTISPECIES: helix-turn-helix domain-containing protein [Stenotrophomonas]|uniref:Helix-turn-helix domain-containing protein n=1 Tax=Stenotrophomonas lactitubi TaxID=2045214 RepID=A0AAW4GJ08_9GAMM|nr:MULTISPECIES: helix-turn-helix transcriptional regulator [unclassified Stenotrophomonas]MBA0448707.1 transcriptional regulator [Stenotrophomonas maltophilia]MBM9913999.1 helix-turn-helix domain-containing protein [Stenotrophomonas lactitubi]MBM9921992.1 helix-turn-helix domain-containing protein [Stenotrophomonas lactitubi]MBM9936557.1 helix-turn-helix domain-containing protein [Stenotrophomonas lactitubi]MCI1111009.1 helix-turn-helix domain-containing protein [Stenotrophomonas maltophilia]
MSATNAPRKASPATDWHPADIVAALHRRRISLRQLALLNGYTNATSLNTALRRPYPQAEALIAEALGKPPQAIWPTRYDADGKPNRGQGGRKPLLPPGAKPSSLRVGRNPQMGASQ